MSSLPMINRELAWIEFNARILHEATKTFLPLLERLKFLSIVSSNFDEFFMVRVAGLKNEIRQTEDGSAEQGTIFQGSRSASRLLTQVSSRVHEIVALQYSCLTREVLPGLAQEGLELLAPASWTPMVKSFLEAYFIEQVFPLITPLRFDEEEELPTIGNLQIHCAFELSDRDGKRHHALAQAPKNSRRFILLPDEESGESGKFRFALLEDLIVSFASKLFPGFSVEGSLVFKVTRDADTGVDESRQDDFLSAMEEVLAGRQNSTPVRLSYFGSSKQLEALLRKRLALGEVDCYSLEGPIDLAGFYELVSLELKGGAGKTSRLRDKPWKPIALPNSEGLSVWEEIETRDRLLFLPYESFGAIQRFLDEAADDPSVLAIKMTLYRTSGDSPVVKALIRAARNRKQVAVVVELKARFDEERNISWASTLEQAGAIVTYGVARLKVHAKAALVLRRARDGSIRKYLHLSTGNYNDKTARIYSDLSLFTANEELCREASAFFNMLTGYSTIQSLKHLAVGPFDLKSRLLALIEREIQKSSAESPGLIEMKLNALADREVIQALYKASKARVRVRLNVRGACTLLPGIPGLSDSIEVRSVVGRYLEHSRMLHFRNGGQDEVYLSSADCLPRNLERRVELMFPVLDESLAKSCREIFSVYFKDNEHSYRMKPDGSWEPVLPEEGEKKAYAQELLYKRIERLAEIAEAPPEQLVVRRRFRSR
ncbi:Polyphosphate kinase [bioreactor metagenome]|jgi:polyphosphate kinase|uniref:ATP-polyphosphate phosphotransferase n=1 Tax=bioreactor metagenome TaxID=1076179 RepID=A0A644TCB8_9ZZZZ|nr:Polyphosphate kinase [uncultured Spirochaetota bacterium]